MFAYGYFYELRPTVGTFLRVTVDIAAIWAGFLIGWAIIHGGDTSIAAGQAGGLLALAICLSAVCFLGYAAAGLYTSSHSSPLPAKLGRVFLVTLGLFAAAGVMSFLASQLLGLTIGSPETTVQLFLVAFLISTALVMLARVTSLVLRSDNLDESNTGRSQPGDENKVLVVGGSGYIGSILVEKLLDQGKEVLVLDSMHFGDEPLAGVAGHNRLTIVREDFRNVEVLTRSMSGVGTVIHLGGLVGDPACALDPDLTIDVNLTATKLVGEIAKACGVKRFIFASSCSVYGACDDIVDEQSAFNPQSLYARTKVASEAVLAPLNDRDFAVTCLRFATVYGISGRARFDLVVNLLCAKAVRDGVITVFGPDQWRPFVHVEDVARAIEIVAEAPIDAVAGEAFNVGSDVQNYTLGQAAKLIKQQVPDAEITTDDNFTDTRNYHVSFDKIQTQLGFEPVWTLERGISQVIAVVRSNQVGHYSLPTYSNLLRLKECDPKSFANFQITGWENDFMNIADVAAARPDNHEQSNAA